jgi:hypothetical protein
MTYSLDIEFVGGELWCDFVQADDNPAGKAMDILREDPNVQSIAVRKENGKLVKIFDYRDLMPDDDEE